MGKTPVLLMGEMPVLLFENADKTALRLPQLHIERRRKHGLRPNTCNRKVLCLYPHIETAQKATRRSFEIVIGADHDFHPSDDTDRFFRVALQLSASFGNRIQVVDQDVGVEQRLHHSLRTFS